MSRPLERSPSLAHRLILGIVPLALLGIWTTSLFLYRIAREPLLKSVQKEVDAVAQTAQKSVESYVEARRRDLDAAAESSLIRDYYKNKEYGLAEEAAAYRGELTAHFRAVSARTGAFKNILYVDGEGKDVARIENSPAVSEAARRLLREPHCRARAGLPLSEITTEHPTAAPVWVIGRPVCDAEGRIRGGLVMAVGLEDLSGILGGLKAGENGFTALISASGECLLGECSRARRDMLLSERGVQGGTWAVRASARIDDFLGPLDRVRNYALLLSAVCGLIVGLLIWAQVAQVTAPLKDLVEAARRLGEGELGHRVAVRGSPEIAGLSGHFNAMASSLQVRDSELKARLREMESLKALSDAVLGELDYDQISRLCVRAAVDGLGFERGGLYRVEERTGDIRGFCTYNTSQAGFDDSDIARRRIPADSGDILAWVVRERRPANIPDPSTDPRCNPEFVRESRTRGFCLAPVMTSDRVYAVIAVDNRESGRPISDDQVRTLTLFCNAAGLAFQNLVLLHDVYRSEARYRAVVDGSLDAIIALDAEERVTLWNEGARRIFGYSAGEMEGSDLRRLFSADEWERLKSAASGREPLINCETRGKSREGKALVLSLTWTRSGPRTAEAPEWSLVLRDITAEKAILCQLIQSEKLALTDSFSPEWLMSSTTP